MEDNFQKEIEKIRKKTFNPELQKLVDGIIQKDGSKNTGGSDKYELLAQIHDLFYKALNLSWSEQCNDTDFRYDYGNINTGNTDFHDIYIRNAVILEYDGISEVYRTPETEENDVFRTDLVFCPSETIYKKIFMSGKPVKLDRNFMQKNDVDKRLHFLAEHGFYAVSFNSVLKQIWSRYVKFSSTFDFSRFNPVILFSLGGGIDDDVFMKKLLPSFYLRLYSFFSSKPTEKTPDENIKIMLERYSKEMSVFNDVSLFIIKIDRDFSNEFYFLLKFLKNKLDKSVLNSSRIALADKNCIIAFISNTDSRKFLEEIDDFSSHYDNCFRIIKINEYRNSSINQIIRQTK